MGSRKSSDPRKVRQRHEEAIAELLRRREALRAEISALEATSRERGAEVVARTLDLLALLEVLDETYDDAEWLRRKAAIRGRVRDLVAGRVVPPESAARPALPPTISPALARTLHEMVDAIQRDNQYARVSGDYSEKTALQNRLLERYGDLVDVRWDGPNLLLLEFQGRSAGHLPIDCLSPAARRAVGKRLGLA